MMFYRLLIKRLSKRANEWNCVHRVSSNKKILSSIIEKAGVQVIPLIISQQMSKNYEPCFNIINFFVIPFYIKLLWHKLKSSAFIVNSDIKMLFSVKGAIFGIFILLLTI